MTNSSQSEISPRLEDFEAKNLAVVSQTPLLGMALDQIARSVPGVLKCDRYETWRDLQRNHEHQSVDVVLLELATPFTESLHVLAEMKREKLRVLLVGPPQSRPTSILECLRAGALGFVSAEAEEQIIESAIAAVLRGDLFLTHELSLRLIGHLASKMDSELSHREVEVVQLIASGRNSRDIGADLGLSVKTIETHRRRIMTKLGVSNSASLICAASQEGYLAP